MYNRTPYNRTQYNRKARFVFEWTATANAESGSGGALIVIRYLAGTAEAETSASGEVVRILLFTSAAEAVAEAIGDYIRTLFFEGDAIAEANASGTGVSTYGQEVMVVEGVNMVQRGTWHTIEVLPDTMSRIVGAVFSQTFCNSRGGGDY